MFERIEASGDSSIFCFTRSPFLRRKRCTGGSSMSSADGFPQDDGCFLLVVHADGASGGAVDEERRDALHHDLLRQPDGGAQTITLWGSLEAALEAAAVGISQPNLAPRYPRCTRFRPGPLATRAAFWNSRIRRADGQAPTSHRAYPEPRLSIDRDRRRGDGIPGARRREAYYGGGYVVDLAALSHQ